MLMKKYIVSFLTVVFAVCLLTGCGSSFDPSISSLYIQKDGKITQAIVGTFEKAYYSLDEFESMVTQEVDAYNSQYGEQRIEIERLEEKNDTVYLLLDFADADTYEHYSEEFCFTGTIGEALDHGFSFNMEFRDADYEDCTLEEVTAHSGDLIAILKEEGVVQFDHPVKYVSNNVEILSENMVEVMPIDDEDEYAYIIY